MEKTKFNGLDLYVKRAPKRYPVTPQQERMRQVAKQCGIRKGITKQELMTAMRDCVGPAMRKERPE